MLYSVKIKVLVLFLGMLSILSGCSTGKYLGENTSETPITSNVFVNWHDTDTVYRLQNGDLLEVVHPYASDLDRQVRILPDGRIFLPLVGGIQAADLIPEQLVDKIEAVYRSQQMKQPAVTIIPAETNPQKVFVGGEVVKPGIYEFKDKIGVAEALFMAGGMKNTAKETEVVLLRRTLGDKAMIRTVNVEGVLAGMPGSGDLPLHQYDIIYVPRTAAAEVGKFVEQYITNIIPFSRSFSYSLSRDIN